MDGDDDNNDTQFYTRHARWLHFLFQFLVYICSSCAPSIPIQVSNPKYTVIEA